MAFRFGVYISAQQPISIVVSPIEQDFTTDERQRIFQDTSKKHTIMGSQLRKSEFWLGVQNLPRDTRLLSEQSSWVWSWLSRFYSGLFTTVSTTLWDSLQLLEIKLGHRVTGILLQHGIWSTTCFGTAHSLTMWAYAAICRQWRVLTEGTDRRLTGNEQLAQRPQRSKMQRAMLA